MSDLLKYSYRLGTRICLAGEGLGLYGGKAITIPIDSPSTTVTVTLAREQGSSIVSREETGENLDLVVSAIQQAMRARGFDPDGFHLLLESSVPTGYGLASSATLYASVTECLNRSFGYNMSIDDVGSIAYEAEHVINKVLVGKTDTNAVLHREIMLHDYGVIPACLSKLRGFPSNTSMIIVGDKPSSYAGIGLLLKKRVLSQDKGIEEYRRAVDVLVPQLAEAFDCDDRKSISSLIQEIFKSVHNDLGVANPDYHRMVETALSAGAYAAKNVGLRTTGGCVYALCDSADEMNVCKAFGNSYAFVKILKKDQIK